MLTDKFGYLSGCKHLFVLFGLVFVCICLYTSLADSGDTNDEVVNFSNFHKALDKSDDSESIRLGDLVFRRLEEKYRNDVGFSALKSKLIAAEFLAEQMESQLKKAAHRQMSAIADGLFENNRHEKDKLRAVALAKSFYETSAELFSKPVRIKAFENAEKNFLAKYYDLKLRIFTGSVAKAGQALVIAEPYFRGMHDYVLVLPLLHASGRRAVSIESLPQWMRQPEQLDIFSDSCLLHYGFIFQAMALARRSAQMRGVRFSELQFYKSATEKCSKTHPRVALDCLKRAMDYIPEQEKPEMVVKMQFKIVQLWLDLESYALAAGEARKISDTFPGHEQAGRALWLYYYALSKSNNTKRILAEIDNALADKRCEEYKAKLVYMKWWSLRRERGEPARIAALEYEILKHYGKDPIVAPIMLSRSTDLLAQQDYVGAESFLTELVEKFPETQAAVQAKEILIKLENKKGV